MSLSFDEITQLREGVIKYSSKFNEEQLKTEQLEGLVSFITESTGKDVKAEDLGKIFYHEFHQEKNLLKNIKDYPVWMLNRYVTTENESINRVEKIIGKSVSQMTNDELTNAAIRMFTIQNDEYQTLIEQNNVAPDDRFDQIYDPTILSGVIQAKGINFGKAELRQNIMDKKDLGLEYFTEMFKKRFEYFSEDKFTRDEGIGCLLEDFHRRFSEQKANLERHLVADKQLTERHTIAQPKILTDKTLNLEIIPYAIDFTKEGKLAVLGGQIGGKENDRNSSQMLLNIYDANNSKLIKSINTNIHSRFDGAAGMAFSFQGSLTVGSDDIIYVNGGSKRYSKDLEELTDNESNFKDAIEVLKNQNILDWQNEVLQIIQSDGVLYFAIQPRDFPKSYNNIIAASDGKNIIGKVLSYSPNNGSGSSAWNDTARIVAHGNDIYFKASKKIFSVDKSFTDDAWDKAFLMAGNDSSFGATLSNHCVSPAGILYVVNQFQEEAAQSIQGYIRGKEKGEFATHVYPEDYPGGLAAFRTMAINKDGILAYTNQENHKVHLYQLEK